MTSERVRVRDDIELGSMGAKWRHGWVPLNPQATAIKLKKLKAGGRNHIESHGEHTLTVAPSGRSGRFGALVSKGGESHYSEHATHGDALRAGRQHIAGQVAASSAPRDPWTGKTRMEELRATAKDLRARGASRSAARHRREMRQTDRAKAAEKAAERATSTPAARKPFDGIPDAELHRRLRAAGAKQDPVSREDRPKLQAEIRRRENAATAKGAAERRAAKSRGVDKVSETTPFDRAMRKLVPSHKDGTGNMTSGVHETNAGRMIVSKSGGKPWNEQSQLNVEHSNGAMLGHITVQPNGKYAVEDYRGKMPKHEVATHTQALAALGAAHTLHMKEIADKKAADDAKRKADSESWQARKKAEDDAKKAAQREKDIKSARAQVARDEANRRRMRDVAKGIKPTVTKSDSTAKVKAREQISATLSATTPVDLHTADLNNVKEGRIVKFKTDVHEQLPQGPHSKRTYLNANAQEFEHPTHGTFVTSHDGAVKDPTYAMRKEASSFRTGNEHADFAHVGNDVVYRHHAKNGGIKVIGKREVTGHVVHNGHGIIALSDGKNTYSAETKGRNGRLGLYGSVHQHNAAADKAMIEDSRKRNVVDTTIKVPLKPIPQKSDYDKAVALIKQRAAEKRAKAASTVQVKTSVEPHELGDKELMYAATGHDSRVSAPKARAHLRKRGYSVVRRGGVAWDEAWKKSQ